MMESLYPHLMEESANAEVIQKTVYDISPSSSAHSGQRRSGTREYACSDSDGDEEWQSPRRAVVPPNFEGVPADGQDIPGAGVPADWEDIPLDNGSEWTLQRTLETLQFAFELL